MKEIIKIILVISLFMFFSFPCFAARPLNTDDAGTVEKGRFEIEGGFEQEKSKDIDEVSNCFKIQLKYGMLENLDAGIEVPYSLTDPSGIQDATLKGKLNIFEESESIPALSIGFNIKLANGDKEKGLGSGFVDYGISSILSKEFGEITSHANIQYTFVGVEEGSDPKNVVFYGIAFEYPINDICLIGEVFGETPVYSGVDPTCNAQLGANWTINDLLRIDGGLTFGLNEVSPGYIGTLGFTLSI